MPTDAARAPRSHTARFVAGASTADRLPASRFPEIAFAGRSNVGKSSLLNRLTGHSRLARVSKTPGRTQQINFFLIDERLVFVDLPGYGFARVPLAVKEKWKGLVESYLVGRAALHGVVVLVDLRRGIEKDDLLLLDFLQANEIAALVVCTKSDKLGRGPLRERLRAVAAEASAHGAVATVACSAESGEGTDLLWRELTRLL